MNDPQSILFPMLQALTPPEQIQPSKWAEREIVLPRTSTARAGRLRASKLQAGMMDVITEPGIRRVFYMTSAQLGKTLALNAALGHQMATEGGPIMIVRPDEQDCTSYARENLDPLIKASPALRELFAAGDGTDNRAFRSYRGGSLALVSSYKASALAGKAIRVLLADETDRMAQSVSTGEGCPITLAQRRLHTYRNSLFIAASTPTFESSSRISKLYLKGDQRKYHVPCLACGALDHITPERLVFERGNPSSARLRCPACGHLADEAERLRMVEHDAAEWIATAEGEAGTASFYANELCSIFSSLEHVAAQVDVAVSLEDKKALQNLCWGVPYSSNVEVEIQASELQERAIILEAPYPSSIDFFTAGVDVQSNRLEVAFVGHVKATNERYLIDHIVLPGDTGASINLVWRDLYEVLGTVFPLQNGKHLPLSATFIDAGFQTQAVVENVVFNRKNGRRVFPSFGRAGWDRPATKEGSKIRGAVRSMIVGVDNLKLGVMQSLAVKSPGPNYFWLPAHIGNDAFAQLASEHLEVHYNTRGFPAQRWVKQAAQRNELLDVVVYATAAASLVSRPAKPINSKEKEPSIADAVAKLHATTNQPSQGTN